MIVEVKFEPRDAWVGLFWDRRLDGLHLYVCLVPFVVIHAACPDIHPHLRAAVLRLWADHLDAREG